MASTKALITPEVIKWARKKARLDVATAAKKIGRPEEEIIKWETGDLFPTIAQARKASKVYKRSLAVFYLPSPPSDFDTLRDFRTLPSGYSPEYSPELALLLRQLTAKQTWLHDYLLEDNARELEFAGSVSVDCRPLDIAAIIRENLNVSPAEQIKCRDHREALNLWINRAERIGINICRRGGISLVEARGFLLSDGLAPFIYINNTDALPGQLFTLIHELAHLWLNMPGLSNLIEADSALNTPDSRIEKFCNQIASEVLLERNIFDDAWRLSSIKSELQKRISFVSRKLKVSDEAVARRLLDLSIIDKYTYEKLRVFYQDRWDFYKLHKSKTKSGRPSYSLLVAIDNGRLFSRTVISAYRNNQISGRDASFLLNTKVKHFPKIGAQAGLATL
ncbi:MAG: XRE family transcriptional regulator [Desulfarculus sp.]|nr:XRE family transcriptional regulator [Pseudomonadota bacterium]MBU4599011.1 XRE family transcriptional regulator [Pseudomonadota bacterium]MBV1714936.1 XRE family transcriptional regulator [Desulfarculus sp.]MBV1737436.1 XRE family transcriptional regulator [Desulfarculus sp.]